MTKWEYLDLSVDADKSMPRWLNGVEIRNWKQGMGTIAYCNKLGEEGWEVINRLPVYYSGGGLSWYSILFKRPKP